MERRSWYWNKAQIAVFFLNIIYASDSNSYIAVNNYLICHRYEYRRFSSKPGPWVLSGIHDHGIVFEIKNWERTSLMFYDFPTNPHILECSTIPEWDELLPGVNTLRPRHNGRHFADDIFKCIFSNENVWIPIKISLKFVPTGSINNIPALVQIMAWRRPGDKPLSETMMVRLLTHICVTRPQWVKSRIEL